MLTPFVASVYQGAHTLQRDWHLVTRRPQSVAAHRYILAVRTSPAIWASTPLHVVVTVSIPQAHPEAVITFRIDATALAPWHSRPSRPEPRAHATGARLTHTCMRMHVRMHACTYAGGSSCRRIIEVGKIAQRVALAVRLAERGPISRRSRGRLLASIGLEELALHGLAHIPSPPRLKGGQATEEPL